MAWAGDDLSWEYEIEDSDGRTLGLIRMKQMPESEFGVLFVRRPPLKMEVWIFQGATLVAEGDVSSYMHPQQ